MEFQKTVIKTPLMKYFGFNKDSTDLFINIKNESILIVLNEFILRYSKIGIKCNFETSLLIETQIKFYTIFSDIIRENDVEYFKLLSKYNSIIYSVKDYKNKYELSLDYWTDFNDAANVDVNYVELFKLFLDYRIIHLHKLINYGNLICHNTSIYNYLYVIYSDKDFKLIKL
jgi:hypothetical protein